MLSVSINKEYVKTALFWLPLIISLILCSCRKKDNFDLNSVAPELIGERNWIETIYYFYSDELDVYSLESSFRLKIDENGYISWFKDGLLVGEFQISGLERGPRSVIIEDSPVYEEYLFRLHDTHERELMYLFYQFDDDQVVTKQFPFFAERGNSGSLFVPYNVFE